MEPMVGQIIMFGGTFTPRGWMFCEGQILEIQEGYEPLYAVIRNQYGGDGIQTFALPDLRDSVKTKEGTQGIRFIIAVEGFIAPYS